MKPIAQDEICTIMREVYDEFSDVQEDQEWAEYRKALLGLGVTRTFELLEAKGYRVMKTSRTLN